jgi:hypothetical protein
MKSFAFRRWRWDLDFGSGLLRPGEEAPDRYWVAFVDDLGRLCRVNKVKKQGVQKATSEIKYDYFCDSTGRVLQKRGYDDADDLYLIVDFSYGDDGWVTETAVWIDGTTKSIRRKVEFHPMYGAED